MSLPAERFVTPVPLQFLRSELPARLCFASLLLWRACTSLVLLNINFTPRRSLCISVLFAYHHARFDHRLWTSLDNDTTAATTGRTHSIHHPLIHTHARTLLRDSGPPLGRSDAAVQHTTTFAPRDATAGSIPLTTPPRPPDSLACLSAPQ